MDYIIREIKPSEVHLLENFLYEAIFQKDENNLLPRDVINKPELRVYIEDFGKQDDLCLVAEADGEPVGAVWTRIISGDMKGFGYVDDNIPEFSISLYKEYRNKGIGTSLMKRMLQLLKEKGYEKASLSVQKDNYAVKLYQSLGFEIIRETEEEYKMLYYLNK